MVVPTNNNRGIKVRKRTLVEKLGMLGTLEGRLVKIVAIAGFFGTGTSASPGNYGLKDVATALRWIRENIGPFGGDPNSVTLWGHGEAASLVHTLALTKKTEGLFHRYVTRSVLSCLLKIWTSKGRRMFPTGTSSRVQLPSAPWPSTRKLERESSPWRRPSRSTVFLETTEKMSRQA